MAITESYLETLSIFLCFLLLCYYLSRVSSVKKSCAPTNWPIIGMMPAVFQHVHHAHDYITEVLEESGGTFVFKGPWFANMEMVFTSDPANVHYILSKNFSNYPKGPEFRKIFDILGDGIFNSDSQLWELHRKLTMSVMNQASFQQVLERTIWQKVEEGLLPVLDSFAGRGAEIDLQDIFQRFTFDSITKLMLDHDPGSLSIDLPYIPCEKAFNDVVEALFHRHILPESCWRIGKFLGIGKEKNLSRAWVAFDQFIYSCITLKQEKLKHTKASENSGGGFNCLTALMEAYRGKVDAFGDSNLFLRDILLNLMFAGRDTTSTALTWLFWLLARSPSAVTKIREEIGTKLNINQDEKWRFFNVEESCKLVYLHGALCEALRLFPPVALEHKAPVKSDVLPSGLHVDENTKLVLSFYSMGRMESIWGKYCLEFKPERWISERGKVKHEPSFKFPAFNAGPRTCIGKEMAFIQMKMVAATIIYNYQIRAVEGHPVNPRDSIILQMKQGFLVRLSKTS